MDPEELWDMCRRRVLRLPPSGSPSSAVFMDPDTSDDESPAASSSSSDTSSQGGHGEGDKSDLTKMEEEVEDLLTILRDAGEIDDELAREIDYKMARIKAARDAAINKARGRSMIWQYLIMPAATGFGRGLFHTATAFLGCYLTFMYIFGGWRPSLLWSRWWSKRK